MSPIQVSFVRPVPKVYFTHRALNHKAMPADLYTSKTGLVKTPNRTVSAGRATNRASFVSPTKSRASVSGQNTPNSPATSRLEGAAVAASPQDKRRATMESEHQGELLKRQDIHSTLLAATEGRRDRAHAILDLHRGEIGNLEAIIRQSEADTTQLDDLRKDLADAMRRQEVVAFRSTKDVKLMQQKEQQKLQEHHHRNGTAAAGIASSYLKASLGQQPISSSSPLRTLFSASMPGLSISASANTAVSEWEMLNDRLAEARRVGDELEKDCTANEELLANRRKERGAIKDLIAVAEEHLKVLESDAPATLDKLKVANARLKTATEHSRLLPDLRRMVEDNASTLHLQKQSSTETTRALMDHIKADDGKLQSLRAQHGGRPSSDQVSTVAGQIAHDLEGENAYYEAQLRKFVFGAEEQRLQLQSTAEMLSSRVRYLEDRAAKMGH